MKLNKKVEALGTGDNQAEAVFRNKTQRAVTTGWRGTASGALQGSGSVQCFY